MKALESSLSDTWSGMELDLMASSVLGRTTDWVLLRGCGPHGVSVKGNTYWVASDSRPPYHDEFLLNFDFSKERFKKFSLPLDFISCSSKDLSVVREEQICLSGSFSTDLHVWVTTISDGSVMSWRKYLNVKDIGYDFYCGMSLLATEQNENIVCCKKFIKVYRHGATATSTSKFKSYCSMLLDYVPSLAQIQQDTRDL
ncbi:putative F-box protein [Cardamine amara subsp. amara]|uniref:F-box protein n=1 Tax=Cardamine amara subsp. amara TaxID=228776 RepID=A0ABD1B1M6_CARAN